MRQLLAVMALLLVAPLARTQDDMSQVEIKSSLLGHGLYMLVGRGGNIVASVGEDGVFIVDDQYAPLTPKLKAALAQFTDKPVRFVINTHWHGDHTGGNENFATGGAVIVAHDNVYKRMSSDQFIAAFNKQVPAAPHAALPVVSFADHVTLHLNGDEVQAIHVEHAHTDGDALVNFPGANVLHMGDLFWNGMFPFIDASSGGSIDGMIAGVDKGLALSNAQTKIVPGHGPLGDRASLAAFGNMLRQSRTRIAALRAKGKSLQAVIAAKPLAEFEDSYGEGFVKTDTFIEYVYNTLPRKKGGRAKRGRRFGTDHRRGGRTDAGSTIAACSRCTPTANRGTATRSRCSWP